MKNENSILSSSDDSIGEEGKHDVKENAAYRDKTAKTYGKQKSQLNKEWSIACIKAFSYLRSGTI